MLLRQPVKSTLDSDKQYTQETHGVLIQTIWDRNDSSKSTRPKPAYGRQGLDWIVGPGYTFGAFSAPSFAPPALSSVDDSDGAEISKNVTRGDAN